MSRRHACSALVFGAILLTASCASGPPKDSFPSRASVQSLAEKAPAPLAAEPRFVTPSWTLEGPLPELGGDVPRSDATPLEAMIAESGTRLPFAATESMHCAARELARILALEGTLPGERLERFLYGACGNPTSTGAAYSLVGDVADDIPHEELLSQWKKDILGMVKGAAPGKGSVGGVALYRGKGVAAVVVTARQREIEVKPFPLTPDESGHLTLEGRSLVPAEMFQALANHGLYGVRRCTLDPAVRAPELRARCPVDTSDESAWISAAAYAPERMVGNSIVQVLARPGGAVPLEYKEHAYAPSTPRPATNEALGPVFTELLNGVRAKAGHGEVSYVAAQSVTAMALSRHLVAALGTEGDDDRVEEVMLGLLAGWDVDAPVVDGTVAWTQSGGTNDVADMLGMTLEWPGGREALLEPRFNLIAVGPTVSSDGSRTTLLLGSWERFEGHSIKQDSREAFLALERARKRLKKPLGIMPDVDERALALAKEIDDGGSASTALNALLNTAVARYQHNMNAWVIYPRTLEDIVWPDELLDARQVYVSVAVAVEGHPDIAWNRKVILLVAHFPEGAQVADEGPQGPPPASVIAAAE